MRSGLALTLALGVAVISISAKAEGIIRSIWGCQIPCASKDKPDELLGYINVSYCATTSLSRAMLANLNPACQIKTRRSDAVAARSVPTDVAHCSSSSNACPKEGLTKAGFTCQYVCPSEDPGIRKYTACATTDTEAWSHAKEFCADATPPDGSFFARAHTCTPEGQTPCD